MNSGEVPDVATLAKATAGLLRQGSEQSERLRQRLALVYGIDPSGSSWPRFVNNHAWALVRLQAQGVRIPVEGDHGIQSNVIAGSGGT